MSKHKNKKNKAATPKEPITRRDLCERIYVLHQESNTLRHINTSLTYSADFHKNASKEALKLAEDSANALERGMKRVRRYRTMNKFLIFALILSGLSHLIYLFI